MLCLLVVDLVLYKVNAPNAKSILSLGCVSPHLSALMMFSAGLRALRLDCLWIPLKGKLPAERIFQCQRKLL